MTKGESLKFYKTLYNMLGAVGKIIVAGWSQTTQIDQLHFPNALI